MGNQNSANGGGLADANNPELFRKQSIRKSSIGYAAPSVARAKRFMELDLNKSHSLHDFDVNGGTSGKKISNASCGKHRRQSTANEALFGRKRSTVSRLSGVTNASGNSSTCTSRASPTSFIGGVGYGDTQEDQYINGFGSAMASSSSTSAFHHTRTASTNSSSGGASSSAASSTRQKSMKRSEAQSHPISMSGREIIQFCFENAPLDFGTRMCTRIYEKRADYQRFSQQLGREKWYEMTHSLRDFLQRVIAKIENLEVVEKIARKYGEDHLPLKSYGFKPDFWVTLADLLTVEGVMLDQATHTHTEAVTAWSLFISILFSSIRDGYYSAMREQRNSIRKRSNGRQTSVGSGSNFHGVQEAALPVVGLQQLQIPSSDDCSSGGFLTSGSLSPVEGVKSLQNSRCLRGSSVHVGSSSRSSGAASRKYSAAGSIAHHGRLQSPNG